MRKILILTFLICLFLPLQAKAATYYVAQSSAGSGDGSSYANRQSVSSHNSDTYAGDDIIYLCDTITSAVVPPSSGTSGHRITYRGDYAAHAGTIAAIYSVINGTIATAPAAITTEIAGVAVTGGAITITHTGSVAGTVDSCTPTALNTVTAGQAIEIITSGASTNTVIATFTILITR